MLFCLAADNCWAPPSHEDDWHNIHFGPVGFFNKTVFQHYRQEECQDKVFLSQPPLFCVYNQPAFGQRALEASWSSCRVPGPRWFSVRWQNFSPWKKTNRCVPCSPAVKMNLLSAAFIILAVECWWTYADDTLDLCLLAVLWEDEKKVDSCSLLFFFIFFFCYWC